MEIDKAKQILKDELKCRPLGDQELLEAIKTILNHTEENERLDKFEKVVSNEPSKFLEKFNIHKMKEAILKIMTAESFHLSSEDSSVSEYVITIDDFEEIADKIVNLFVPKKEFTMDEIRETFKKPEELKKTDCERCEGRGYIRTVVTGKVFNCPKCNSTF